jgi:hypothetical protein
MCIWQQTSQAIERRCQRRDSHIPLTILMQTYSTLPDNLCYVHVNIYPGYLAVIYFIPSGCRAMLSCQHASKTISSDWKAGSKTIPRARGLFSPWQAPPPFPYSVWQIFMLHRFVSLVTRSQCDHPRCRQPSPSSSYCRRRRHSGSRHCHNGAFLTNFRIADIYSNPTTATTARNSGPGV